MESEYDGQQGKVIEICTGPQCSVSGASAALREIEDLAIEANNGFRIQEEGCRDFCTVGPNVYCSGSHFSKVQSPEECERIAQEIDMLSADNTDPIQSTVGKMMRRKSNRKRWQLLRNISRQKSAGVNKSEKWKKELHELHGLEVCAAASSESASELNQRADRRLKRLLQYVDDT
mmetsp:Transcript_25273/g.62226  ORF Transcript_25273/g.62226 Transcript_25273/m.62226 type:complete len:175 (+) Transcript_25273:33-557(+)